MSYGGRVFTVGKTLLLVAALTATFFLFAGVAMRVALRAREVAVPALVGRSVSDASRLLTDSGLAIRVDDVRRPDDTVPAGRVLQQDPPAGVAARRQRTVRVWLSAGPRATMVTNMVGQSERTARLRLEQDGVTLGAVTDLHSADYPTDVVVAQDPPAPINAGRVTLLVNRGADTAGFLMPDLIGLEGRRTGEALRELGFRVTLSSGPISAGGPGAIVRQSPAAGARLRPGDAISFEVTR
jgi:serine/threonine-protein kinase